MSHKTQILVIIDPQNDFMDSPNYVGSLAVKGAYNDMLRLADRIRNDQPDDIVVTLDSHPKMHIAHPIWWVNSEGKNPDLFTVITVEDVEKGVWKAALPEQQEYSNFYVKKLAEQGNYDLRIWPFHCVDNTEGQNVEQTLLSALQEWEHTTGKKVTYIRKGTNPKTEHYSVFKAEVVLEDDPQSQLKTQLIKKINSYDKVIFAGEAASHCVAGSLLDYLANIPQKDIAKTVLLKDCTSPVTGYEQETEKFFDKVLSLGVQLQAACEVKKLKM